MGSCWVQIDKREHNEIRSADEYVKTLLEIPQHKAVLSIIAIGYPAEKRTPADESKLLFDRIHLERFQ